MRPRIAIACIVAGCGAPHRPSPPPDTVEHDLVAKVLAADQRMHRRFAATEAIRTAIALGDTARARVEARAIVALDEPDFLPEWRPYVDDIRAAAAQVSVATDPIAAAKTLAVLGRRCAQCHVSSRARIGFPPAVAPPGNTKLVGQMTSHAWAAARMWEGLVGPSEASWRGGAEVLAEPAWPIAAEGEVPGHELGIADDVARVRLLASRAAAAGSLDARSELYGELLATCAHCHAAIRDR